MRVLGVLNGNLMPPERVAAWARSAEVTFAADGGANLVAGAITVGDFDSISAEARSDSRETIYEPDQDRSDCDKLLALAYERGATEITLCNVEGDLPDHFLATLQSSARSPLRVRLALTRGIAFVVCTAPSPLMGEDRGEGGRVPLGSREVRPPYPLPRGERVPEELRYSVPLNCRVSLLPLVVCEGVSLDGVEWPLQDALLHPLGLTSISNRAREEIVSLRVTSGAAVLFFLHPELERPNW